MPPDCPPTPPLAIRHKHCALKPVQSWWFVPMHSPAPQAYREPTPAVESSNDKDDTSSEDPLAAAEPEDAMLVLAGLDAVYTPP